MRDVQPPPCERPGAGCAAWVLSQDQHGYGGAVLIRDGLRHGDLQGFMLSGHRLQLSPAYAPLHPPPFVAPVARTGAQAAAGVVRGLAAFHLRPARLSSSRG